MKSPLLIFLLVVISNVVYSQNTIYNRDTVVEGKVTAKRNNKEIGLKSEVTIAGTDGTYITKTTDDEGNFFYINKEIKPDLAFVISCKPIYHTLFPFFGNTTRKLVTTNINENDLPIKYIIEVSPAECRGLLPYFLFENNSAEINDETLKNFVITLNDNPTVIMELGGRALSTENNPKKLAQKRSEELKTRLVKSGIIPERLLTVNYTDTLYHIVDWYDQYFEMGDTITPLFIEKLSDPEQIKFAQSLNRMMQLRVVQTDYLPKK